jgi:Ca2+/H+ antiporter
LDIESSYSGIMLRLSVASAHELTHATIALLCHLLPLLFTYSAASAELTAEPSLYLSRAASIVMLGAYFAYLIFQLWTHRQLFEAEDVCFFVIKPYIKLLNFAILMFIISV